MVLLHKWQGTLQPAFNRLLRTPSWRGNRKKIIKMNKVQLVISTLRTFQKKKRTND